MMCSICLVESVEESVEWECGFSEVCRECSEAWIKTKVGERQFPTCIKGCKDHTVSQEFVYNLILGNDELYAKYDYLVTEMNIPIADRIYCAKCTFPLKKAGTSVKCHICSHTNTWTDKQSDAVATEQMIKKFGYQTCHCGYTIEKIQFCDKITCKCGRVFCYVCNSDYKNESGKYKKICSCHDFSFDEEFIVHLTRVTQTVVNSSVYLANGFDKGRKAWFENHTSLFNNIDIYKKMVAQRRNDRLGELKSKIKNLLIKMAAGEAVIHLSDVMKTLDNDVKQLQTIERFIVHNRGLEIQTLRKQLADTQSAMVQMKRKLDYYEDVERKRIQVTINPITVVPLGLPPLPLNIGSLLQLPSNSGSS